MILPYIPENLLEIGNYKVRSYDNGILIVDNWYRNYESLYDISHNISVPRWKWDTSGRNFLDYYDCRISLEINHPDQSRLSEFFETLGKIMFDHFEEYRTLDLKGNIFNFNYYKNIRKNIPSDLQHYPHRDYTYNCIVYLDKVCSGGTALYKNLTNLEDEEHLNLLKDTSNLEKIIIPAKPNRLVIFYGDIYHGAYIADHSKYVSDWRVNQVFFLQHIK